LHSPASLPLSDSNTLITLCCQLPSVSIPLGEVKWSRYAP
jgi:hypothetical protein